MSFDGGRNTPLVLRILRAIVIGAPRRRTHDRQVFKLQIRERNAHRACERRRIDPLGLYAETAAALEP
jgi:hypothetical protein